MNLRRHLADTLTRLAGAIRPPHAMGAHPSAATGAGWTELPRRVERNGTFRFNGVAYLAPRATWGDLVAVLLPLPAPPVAPPGTPGSRSERASAVGRKGKRSRAR